LNNLAEIFSVGNKFAEEQAAAIVKGIVKRADSADFMSRLSSKPAVSFQPKPYVSVDPSAIPTRDWLYGRHLIRRYVSGKAAAGAVGKTSLQVVESLAQASGRPLLGKEVPRPMRVWLFNLEDDQDEINRRVSAAMKFYGLKDADLGGRLHIQTDTSLVISQTTREGTQILAPVVGALVKAIKSKGIDIFSVDPFVSSHDAPENDSGAMDKVLKSGWIPVARQGNCAVELVHHTTKSAGSSGEATAMSARGSGAFVFACRSFHVLNPMTPAQAVSAGVEKPERYFSVKDDKQNLAPKTGSLDWYKMESVNLGNGAKGNLNFTTSDEIGVVTKWNWPSNASLVEDIPTDALDAIKGRLAGPDWRESDQASNWAGVVVAEILGLEIEEKDSKTKPVKSKIKRMLGAWVKAGELEIVTRPTAKHGPKTFIVSPTPN